MFRYTDLIKGHAAFTRTQFRQTLGVNNIQFFQNIVNTKLISKEALYLQFSSCIQSVGIFTRFVWKAVNALTKQKTWDT